MTAMKNSNSGDNDSVWLKFTDRNMSVMRGGRARHPSRQLAYDIIRSEFGEQQFEWLDVGVVGMVDYVNLRPSLNFAYTGIDIAPAVIKDAKKYLSRPADRLVVANIAEPFHAIPEKIKSSKYSLVSLRHILNHIENVDIPLNNVFNLLTEGGICVLTLHIPLTETASDIEEYWGYPTEEPGKVIRHRLNRNEFLTKTSTIFDIERFVRFKDNHKPQDILVLRKPGNSDPLTRTIPDPEIRHIRPLVWRMVRDLIPTRVRRFIVRS